MSGSGRRGDNEVTWHILDGNTVVCSRCGVEIKSIRQLEEECHG